MAWTGTAVVTAIGSGTVRITGVSLAALAIGTISLNGGAGDIQLPAGFPSSAPSGLNMSDVVETTINPVGALTASLMTQIVKTDTPFSITVTNNSAAIATPLLELYVTFKWKMSGWTPG